MLNTPSVRRGRFPLFYQTLKGFIMFKKILGFLGTALIGVMGLVTSSYAVIDTAAVTAKLAEGEAAVAAIGAAILVVWAIKKVYSMIGGR